MGQFPMVNVIDPATPAASSGAKGVASNLNQQADRKVRMAELAAQSRIAQARIASEEKIASAQIQAAGEQAEADRASRSSDYAALRESNERIAQQELQAREAERQARIKREDEILRKQMQVDAETNGVYTSILRADVDEAKRLEGDLLSLQQEAQAAEQELADLMRAGAKGQVAEEAISDLISGAAAEAAAAEKEMRDRVAEATAGAMAVTVQKALESQPGFGRRIRENIQGVDKTIEGVEGSSLVKAVGINVALGTIGATVRAVWDSASNYLGADTTEVRRNALTDSTALVMGTLVEATQNGSIQGLLESAGNPEAAKGALLALGHALMVNVAAHQGQNGVLVADADAKLEQAIVEAKKVVPEQALRGIFEVFKTVESTPGVSEQLAKAQGITASTNWKEANEEAMRLTRVAGWAFDRVASKMGSPAFIRKEAVDPRTVLARNAGALALLEDSPEKFLKMIGEMGVTPQNALKLLETAKGLATDAASAEKVARMEAEIKKRIQSIEGRQQTAIAGSKKRSAESRLKAVEGASERLKSQGLALPIERVLGITGE